MKWIVLAILVFVIPYTYLNLRYRKPGPSYRPYQDAREREGIARAGYARVTIAADRLADRRPAPGGAAVASVPGGLPEDLRRCMIEPPLLPAAVGAVTAPGAIDAGEAYTIQFDCQIVDDRHQIAGAVLYLRGSDVYVVADFERLTAGLTARTRSDLVRLTVPPGALEKGRHLFTLVGAAGSRRWIVQVH